MAVMEASMIHHVGIVLLSIWLLSVYNCCHPAAYFIALIYLYLVHERYVMRLRRKLQFEERRQASQRRVLSDSETVRWLNHAVEKMWPVCMEQIFSQKILLPIIPWFLQKYKPWTAKRALVQHLYLGRSPPMFTEMRVLRDTSDDDHLVMELGMNFRTADDMSAILAVKLRNRLGFGMWAKLHLMGMHVEGKVLVGVKFIRQWPFLGRLRVCFVEPPYFQMTVKPVFTHGLDVTELPGIAGWLDKLLGIAFEQTLVEPNMLVVDMEKFASPQPENWFSVNEKDPIAYAVVELVEAADMKPSDLNGFADPYVKGRLGPYRFRSKTQKKTLVPKWHEEFKIPICSWEAPNVLNIEVCDKDHFVDDTLGDCSINVGDLRDGQRHDMWVPLQNIKMGRLHLAITVVEENRKGADPTCDNESTNDESKKNSFESDSARRVSSSSGGSDKSPKAADKFEHKSQKVADKFEPINVEGQQATGIWVHQPGSDVSQTWEPRKGRNRQLDSQILNDSFGSVKSSASGSCQYDSSNSDESHENGKGKPVNFVKRGLRKIGLTLRKSSSKEDKSSKTPEPLLPSPVPNLRATNLKEIGVKYVVDNNLSAPPPPLTVTTTEQKSPEESGPESPSRRHVKDMAKSILKHAERGMKHAFSRKGSKNLKGDSGSVVTEEGSEISDDESSLPSASSTPRHQAIPVASSPKSTNGNESFGSRGDVQMTKSDSSITNDPVNAVGNVEQSVASASFSSKGSSNSSKDYRESCLSPPKLSEDKIEGDNDEKSHLVVAV